MSKRYRYLLLVLSFLIYQCAQTISRPTGIKIGSIFHDDVNDAAKSRLAAVLLATEQINEAGGIYGHNIEIVNKRPTKGESASTTKAATLAKELHDKDKAVAVISHFSSLAEAIIEVTNTSSYSNFIQCNVSATNSTLNTVTDTSDNFYRTVVSDKDQARLMKKVMQENSWNNIGIYYIDDSFGNGLFDQLKVQLGSTIGAGNPILFAKTFVSGDFNLTNEKVTLNTIIGNYLGGSPPDALILISLKTQASAIIKYLIGFSEFKGGLLLGDGAKSSDIFQIALQLPTWANTNGNKLIGTEVDNYAGINSNQFTSDYSAPTYMNSTPDSFASSAYDCVYAIALSLLYAGNKSNILDYTPADVKNNITKFKSIGAFNVGIGVTGFKNAKVIIESGDTVNYLGASGQLLWDINGDRVSQSMRTFGVDTTEKNFTTVKSYPVGTF